MKFKPEDFMKCPQEWAQGNYSRFEALCEVMTVIANAKLEECLAKSQDAYISMSEGKRLVAMLRSALEKTRAELQSLAKSIDNAPTVRGFIAMGEYFEFGNMAEPHSPSWKEHTHTAKLVCIEEIKEKK